MQGQNHIKFGVYRSLLKFNIYETIIMFYLEH